MLKGITGVLVFVLACLYAAMCGVTRLSLVDEIAQIEQLRSSAEVVLAQESPEVNRKITYWNNVIKIHQTYNEGWWTDWLTPDDWDNIKLIEIPSQ